MYQCGKFFCDEVILKFSNTLRGTNFPLAFLTNIIVYESSSCLLSQNTHYSFTNILVRATRWLLIFSKGRGGGSEIWIIKGTKFVCGWRQSTITKLGLIDLVKLNYLKNFVSAFQVN